MILGILTIIASWLFELPLAWAVTLTVFSSFSILGSFVRAVVTAYTQD